MAECALNDASDGLWPGLGGSDTFVGGSNAVIERRIRGIGALKPDMRRGGNGRLKIRPDRSRLDEDDFDPEGLHLPAHRVAQGFDGMLCPCIRTVGRPRKL